MRIYSNYSYGSVQTDTFFLLLTRVAREIREVISILKTAENVSSLDTLSCSVNVPKSPFEYADKNPEVTETSIASVKDLNPSDVYVVLVGAFVNEPTKPIFHNLINSFVEPDVVTSHVQKESIVEPFSEDIDDSYELSRTLISLVIKVVVRSTIVTSHIPSESVVVLVVETSHNQPVNALETGSEISQIDVVMVPQPDMINLLMGCVY